MRCCKLTPRLQVYDLPFATSKGTRIGMSSYPLTVVSSDDFVYTNQQVQFLCPHTLPNTPHPSTLTQPPRLQLCLQKFSHLAPTPMCGLTYSRLESYGRTSATPTLPAPLIPLLAGLLHSASTSHQPITTSGLWSTTKNSQPDRRRRRTLFGL